MLQIRATLDSLVSFVVVVYHYGLLVSTEGGSTTRICQIVLCTNG